MKRTMSILLVVLLLLLPIGCTVDGEGTNTTTTTTDVTAVKLVTMDIEDWGVWDMDLLPEKTPGIMNIEPRLSAAFEDPNNEGANFRVLVYLRWIDSYDKEKHLALINTLRSLGMPVESSGGISFGESFTPYNSFYTQGTKEQIEALSSLEPSIEYVLWLAPAPRPQGYSAVYGDELAVCLETLEEGRTVGIEMITALDTTAAILNGTEFINGDRLLTEDINGILQAGESGEEIVKNRVAAIFERYGVEEPLEQNVFLWKRHDATAPKTDNGQGHPCIDKGIHARAVFVTTKEHILAMANDPEIRFVKFNSVPEK